jgi:hypothetical protein
VLWFYITEAISEFRPHRYLVEVRQGDFGSDPVFVVPFWLKYNATREARRVNRAEVLGLDFGFPGGQIIIGGEPRADMRKV